MKPALERQLKPTILAAICYAWWGAILPVLFEICLKEGATAPEIVAIRVISAAICALILCFSTSARGFRYLQLSVKTLFVLSASGFLIGINWAIFAWAVETRQLLAASVGSYLTPLLNVVVGGFFLKEVFNRTSILAAMMVIIGVFIQLLCHGGLSWISLALALTFCLYGLMRRMVNAPIFLSVLVECLVLLPPAIWYVAHTGLNLGGTHLHLRRDIFLVLTGPATLLPLAAFGYSARRLPFTIIGVLQFISPTLLFALGAFQGERIVASRAVAFLFIWMGVLTYIYGIRRSWLSKREITGTYL